MLPDSTNPRVMADNIRRLQTEVENAIELPSVETTDEGKVLTVNSSGKWAALDPASQLPAVTSEDEGSLLTVNSSGEWAKGNPIVGNLDYSTTEQDTGLKWIDGKTIYRKVYTGVFPSEETTSYVVGTIAIDRLINTYLLTNPIGGAQVVNYINTMMAFYNTSGQVYVPSVTSGYLGQQYYVIIYYTKPAATREPDDEPEVKKVTKKKTTTKGEN